MSDYIIYDIKMDIEQKLDFDGKVEDGKPVRDYPNHYLGKAIGVKGDQLKLFRNRRGQVNESVPTWVLRNDNGIALIRIHNLERYSVYDMPVDENSENPNNVKSYPYAYVIIDYRDRDCKMAIEKTSNWNSRTETICNCLFDYFRDCLDLLNIGINVTSIKKKIIPTKFDEFIDQRIIDHNDVIESFTIKFPTTEEQVAPQSDEPELTEQLDFQRRFVKCFGGVSSEVVTKMGENANTEKLKKLAYVVSKSDDKDFDLLVKFQKYGTYSCKEGVVAKFPMNDIVVRNYKDFKKPEANIPEHDMVSWLDSTYKNIIDLEENNGCQIHKKPKR